MTPSSPHVHALTCTTLHTHTAINRGLPNIAVYMRTILKREKLTEEAEAYRHRYEAILNSLEQGIYPQRPMSFLGDDDSGYFSANRQRGACVCVYV